jgi:hypothetical protein
VDFPEELEVFSFAVNFLLLQTSLQQFIMFTTEIRRYILS